MSRTVRRLALLAPLASLLLLGCGGGVVCGDWWCVGWSSPCAGCYYPYALATGDFDGDGNQDVATGAVEAGFVSIHFGDGGGGVARELHLQEGTGARIDHLRSGHADADPHLDLLLVDGERGEIRVLRGDGTGALGAAGGPLALGTMGGVRALATGRIDADGTVDVVALDATGALHVLCSDGSGRFAARSARLPLAFGTGAGDVALARVDVDEHLDLVVLDRAAASVFVLLGDGTGGFPDVGSPVAAGPAPTELAAGELDGAPGADVAVVDGVDGRVRVLFSLGDGELLPSSQGPLPLPASRGIGIRILPRPAAPDAPADLAVACANAASPTFVVGFENDGRGTFLGPGLSVPVDTLGPWDVVDLDHDDRMDLVVGNRADGSLGFARGGARQR